MPRGLPSPRTLLPLLWLLLAPAPGPGQDPALSDAQMRLIEIYSADRYDEALAAAEALLAETPDDLLALHIAGRSLADLWRDDEAAPLLARLLARDDLPPSVRGWTRSTQGTVLFRQGRRDEALAAWREVAERPSTRNVMRLAQENLTYLGDGLPHSGWRAEDTEHFEFRFSPGTAARSDHFDTARRERKFRELAAWFGWDDPQPIRYCVWSSSEEAERSGLAPLGYARPAVRLIQARWDQSLGHEMTHVIADNALHPVSGTLLIGEGTATYHDGNPVHRLREARRAWRKRPEEIRRPLAEVWREPRREDMEYAYEVGAALVEMLVERGGREKFLELYRDPRWGRAVEIYGGEFEEWVGRFEVELD